MMVDLAKKETVSTSVGASKFVLRNITIMGILLRNEDMKQIGQTHGLEIKLKNMVRASKMNVATDIVCDMSTVIGEVIS